MALNGRINNHENDRNGREKSQNVRSAFLVLNKYAKDTVGDAEHHA